VPGHRFPLPLVLGSDVSGVVSAVGAGVDDVRPGDPVVLAPGVSCGHCVACLSGRDHRCARFGLLGEHRDGGAADFIVVPRANVLTKPDNLSHEEAAAIPITFLTAWHMLVGRAELRPGETVLVHAGGSGVGSAAIQIAKLWGATVITTASTDEKLERARALGADHGINYAQADFAKEVKALTGRRGVDVVVEHVGAATWADSMRSLAWGGRLVTCGATTGADVSLNLRHVFFKSLSILGSTMGSKGELVEILGHFARGTLRATVDRVLPLDQVGEAHRLLEGRDVFGKIVLRPGAGEGGAR
jgi:NADPH:quinone reductase-like Zn-dependent oxidoreductase